MKRHANATVKVLTMRCYETLSLRHISLVRRYLLLSTTTTNLIGSRKRHTAVKALTVCHDEALSLQRIILDHSGWSTLLVHRLRRV